MAVKSILSIDVQDGSFREFQRQYDKYDKALKSAPNAWKMVQQNIDGSRESFDKLVDSMVASNVQQKLREKAQERADRLSRQTLGHWQAMARATSQISRNWSATAASFLKIGGSTALTALRWLGAASVLSGLAGAGGLFGLDRLASGVAASRRTAFGLGTTIGEQRAFTANFGRLVDPEAFLQNVAGAKFDVTRRVGLLSAGLTPGQIAGDTGQTAVALLRRLKQIADTTNPALFAQVLQARRLDQFATPTDLERLRRTSPAEFQQLIQQYQQRRGEFGLPPGVAKRWQDFETQLTNAGRSIETTLVKGLVGLAPGLTKLSDAVGKTFETLLKDGGPVQRWVEQLGAALEKFAKYVGTKDFQQNVETFVDGVGKIAGVIGDAVALFADRKPKPGGIPGEVAGHDTFNQMWRGSREKRAIVEGYLGGGFENLLKIVKAKEGSGVHAVSPKGAIGNYQILPSTARQYGFDPSRLFDPAYNEKVARAILADLAKKYHGNVSEILAAYNAGPGRANRFRAAGDNPSVLPRETQKYIGGTAGMRIQIDNTTGGSANVSVNALKN